MRCDVDVDVDGRKRVDLQLSDTPATPTPLETSLRPRLRAPDRFHPPSNRPMRWRASHDQELCSRDRQRRGKAIAGGHVEWTSNAHWTSDVPDGDENETCDASLGVCLDVVDRNAHSVRRLGGQCVRVMKCEVRCVMSGENGGEPPRLSIDTGTSLS